MTTAPGSRRDAAAVLLAVAWFALATGLAEAAVQAARHFVFHRFIWAGRDFAWMAPVSYLMFLLPPAAVLALVAWWRPRLVPPALVAGALAALATGLLLRLVSAQRLHPVAIWIFALGVGVQAARAVAGHADAWRAIVRRTLPALAGLVVLVAGATAGGRWLGERRALARLGQAPPTGRNLLLLILDTVRAANLGLYGYPRPTSSTLDSVGRSGVVFERALATAPWTLPSHASIFTGLEAYDIDGGFRRPWRDTATTLAEVLADHGYLTAGFVANHWYTSWETGLGRGFVHYEGYRRTLRQIALGSELGQLISDHRSGLILRTNHADRATDVNAELTAWLARAGPRPFFAFVNYFDAHVPYHTPPEYERRFDAGDPVVDRYDAAVAYVDDGIAELLADLDRLDRLDSTIVVITADHGELLGEHGMENHGNALYTQLLHVPLIVAGPGIPAGVRVEEPVSLRDLAATLVSLAGAPDSLPGSDLARFWTDATPVADPLIVAYVERHPTGPSWYRNRAGPMWSLFAGNWHLIENPDGTEELYDWWADPAEQRDRSGERAAETVRERLARALDSVRAAAAER